MKNKNKKQVPTLLVGQLPDNHTRVRIHEEDEYRGTCAYCGGDVYSKTWTEEVKVNDQVIGIVNERGMYGICIACGGA